MLPQTTDGGNLSSATSGWGTSADTSGLLMDFLWLTHPTPHAYWDLKPHSSSPLPAPKIPHSPITSITHPSTSSLGSLQDLFPQWYPEMPSPSQQAYEIHGKPKKQWMNQLGGWLLADKRDASQSTLAWIWAEGCFSSKGILTSMISSGFCWPWLWMSNRDIWWAQSQSMHHVCVPGGVGSSSVRCTEMGR